MFGSEGFPRVVYDGNPGDAYSLCNADRGRRPASVASPSPTSNGERLRFSFFLLLILCAWVSARDLSPLPSLKQRPRCEISVAFSFCVVCDLGAYAAACC